MAETVNIGEIANLLSRDIFSFFHWQAHPRRDQDFPCNNARHTSKGRRPQPKKTHPGDVIFYYQDPYLGRRVYLHTDLKSYSNKSIGPVKIRAAIESLAMTVECARCSCEWNDAYSALDDGQFDIRGLLFVHNHDGKHDDEFENSISKTDLSTIPVAPNVYVHFLGPNDIGRLYTIANDIIRLRHQKLMPESYSFYYPDLVMWRRRGEVFGQAATIEALTAPYFIITFEAAGGGRQGFVIYYNRPGKSSQEFEYFLDSLSRYQLLEEEKEIRIRMVDRCPDENFLSNFESAKQRYVKAWGLDPARRAILDNINLERVTAVATTYSAPEIGWREK
ncbi:MULTISPECIES: hypothetical protein [Achromobacter]|uniref:hypothetical protein n=1 Tax=Achromobacter TaxID=222 RepID=UPI0006C66E37|nr:hypothetical protein [Achromobacter xylosoxidans]CUJ39829.1 Uncharacterised protein [Achromobacter xylosoxidans]